MKLSIHQLSKHLNSTLLPIYIVSGDEPLQVAQCCDQIRRKAKANGFLERHVFHVETGFNWDDLRHTANSLSLFSQRQLIELRLPSGKPGDGSKLLTEYAQSLSPDNLLLITTGRLDGNQQKSKWFKALDKLGAFIPVWPIDAKQLPSWLQQRLASDGYQATPDALALISERVEGNLLAADQELEKLKLLCTQHTIDADLVRASVSDNARYDVFQLIDAAVAGNLAQATRIFHHLHSEGVEPPIILWALAREVRLLSHLSRQLALGIPLDTAINQSAKVLGFSPFMLKRKKNTLHQAVKRHSEHQLRDMLRCAASIDRSIKGIEKGNTQDELLTLLLSLTGLPFLPSIS